MSHISTASCATSTNPSSSLEGYSGHAFHPPHPTQASSALVCDQHVPPRDSFRSMPDEVIHAHPRMAATMSKSLSCNEALNKSFEVRTFVNVRAGITLQSTSNPSLCSSVLPAPVQEGYIPSPRIGRLSLLRRFLGGSRSSMRSSMRSNASRESEVPDREAVHIIHYETPV